VPELQRRPRAHHLRGVCNTRRGGPEVPFRTERRHAEEGRYDLAAVVWKEITALEPHDPEPRMAHASALALGGDATGAVAVLELAATLDGAPAEIHRELASLYERLGRTRARATY
jgi:Flp pilus assembly protein TadD